MSASIATVGLNPSRREYTSSHNVELTGNARRFETLRSLEAVSRADLTDAQCTRAIETMAGYFDPGKPRYSWFAPLARLTSGMGRSYARREVTHLDLVQEATDPTWSTLHGSHPGEANDLLRHDTPFLRWQIESFPISVLVCNGRTVFDWVARLTDARMVSENTRYFSPKVAFRWWVSLADMGHRPVAVVGWNIPLARPTGMNAESQTGFGASLRDEITRVGIRIG